MKKSVYIMIGILAVSLVLIFSMRTAVAQDLAKLSPQDATRAQIVAANQAWIDAMSSHDLERVVALYDPEAVLWGTRSPTLRDNPAAVREYFNILRTAPPSYKAILGEQRIRIYGDIAINTGTYTFSEVRDGKEIIRPARFSFVYRNRNGHWLIVDHHSSAVPEAPKP